MASTAKIVAYLNNGEKGKIARQDINLAQRTVNAYAGLKKDGEITVEKISKRHAEIVAGNPAGNECRMLTVDYNFETDLPPQKSKPTVLGALRRMLA